MSIRLIALYLVVYALCIYAWKDWFKSLCGLIILTSVVMHPGFPRMVANVQGLNLWNIPFASILLAWLRNRRREGHFWDMPTEINVFLVLWLGVLLFAWVRMVVDKSQLTHSLLSFFSDEVINMIKWPIVGLLLFDGCRTRHRVKMALTCILLLFALFTIQIVTKIPSRAALEPGNQWLRGRLGSDVGISHNGTAKMMSGVPWAMLAMMPLLKKKKYRFLILGMSVTSVYALALTGGRSGFIASGATLVFLCFIRWRRYLLLLPLAVLILPIALPGATARMLQGFGETSVAGEKITNKDAVTAGRNVVWPVVIDKICESPVLGFGREAMRRTGVQQFLLNKFGESKAVTHPHNAYLEVLLESGLIGFVIVVGFHMFILVYSIRLFVDRGDPMRTAAGGLTLALLTGHLVAHMGGQSFYPRSIDVGLWCAIGVMLRLYVERSRLVAKVNDISCQHTQLPRTL